MFGGAFLTTVKTVDYACRENPSSVVVLSFSLAYRFENPLLAVLEGQQALSHGFLLPM